MDVGWVLLGSGAVVIALGLLPLFGLVTGVSRLDGLPVLTVGAGEMLLGLARLRTFPGEDAVLLAGSLCLLASVFWQWRSRRRLKAETQ